MVCRENTTGDGLPTHGEQYVHALNTIVQLMKTVDELVAHIACIRTLVDDPTHPFSARCTEVTQLCDAALERKPLARGT